MPFLEGNSADRGQLLSYPKYAIRGFLCTTTHRCLNHYMTWPMDQVHGASWTLYEAFENWIASSLEYFGFMCESLGVRVMSPIGMFHSQSRLTVGPLIWNRNTHKTVWSRWGHSVFGVKRPEYTIPGPKFQNSDTTAAYHTTPGPPGTELHLSKSELSHVAHGVLN